MSLSSYIFTEELRGGFEGELVGSQAQLQNHTVPFSTRTLLQRKFSAKGRTLLPEGRREATDEAVSTISWEMLGRPKMEEVLRKGLRRTKTGRSRGTRRAKATDPSLLTCPSVALLLKF